MELTDTQAAVTLLAGVLMLVGVAGVIVPVLPGLLLCWLGVLIWVLFAAEGWGRWLVLGAATVLALAGVAVKYAWPGRNLKRAGVPNRTLVTGGLLGLVGFFVIPVVGLVIGFVAGVFLAERVRLADSKLAWPSTVHALRAVGLAMLIELGTALGIVLVWAIGLVTA